MQVVKLAPDPKGARPAAEHIHDNVYWRGAAARISICVPAYRHDVSALMDAIAACDSSALAELVIYDDGSRDHELLARLALRAGHATLAVRIVSAPVNHGRATARNAAISHARAEWILLLDADMMPDNPGFIETYLGAAEMAGGPAVIVGGYSLRTAAKDKAHALHRWQAKTSECLDAKWRRTSPGRYVFSSNVLAHRAVLEACPFDEAFSGWGWEDTDWGLRAEQHFPIVHIDNTATHLGLDTDEALMRKYGRSGGNFLLMWTRHPDATERMPLFRMAKWCRRLPCRPVFTGLAGWAARSRFLPIGMRGRALKAWRALVYAEAVP